MDSKVFYRFRAWKSEITVASFILLVSLVASLCVVAPSYAAEKPAANEMTVSPTSQRIELKPGATYDSSFTILNSSGSSPLDITVSVAPYQVKNSSYEPEFTKETSRTQISRWVSFEKDTYQIEPGGKVSIPFTVTVPSSVPDGGQYAVLFAESNATSQDGTNVMTKKRVGSLLYAHIAGTTKESGKSTIASPFFIQMGKVNSLVTVANEGNTDFDAANRLTVKSITGSTAYDNSKTSAVLPDTTRVVPLEWNSQPMLGLYQVTTSSKVLGKETVASVWVLCISPVVLVLLLVALLAAAGLIAARRRKKA